MKKSFIGLSATLIVLMSMLVSCNYKIVKNDGSENIKSEVVVREKEELIVTDKDTEEDEEKKESNKSSGDVHIYNNIEIKEEESQVIANKKDDSYYVNENSSNSINYSYGSFVIPDSSSRKVTAEELRNLSTYQLAVARNEIYARHGYIFVSDEWKNFFVNESWYTPRAYSVTLNGVEEYNVAKIKEEEARR